MPRAKYSQRSQGSVKTHAGSLAARRGSVSRHTTCAEPTAARLDRRARLAQSGSRCRPPTPQPPRPPPARESEASGGPKWCACHALALGATFRRNAARRVRAGGREHRGRRLGSAWLARDGLGACVRRHGPRASIARPNLRAPSRIRWNQGCGAVGSGHHSGGGGGREFSSPRWSARCAEAAAPKSRSWAGRRSCVRGSRGLQDCPCWRGRRMGWGRRSSPACAAAESARRSRAPSSNSRTSRPRRRYRCIHACSPSRSQSASAAPASRQRACERAIRRPPPPACCATGATIAATRNAQEGTPEVLTHRMLCHEATIAVQLVAVSTPRIRRASTCVPHAERWLAGRPHRMDGRAGSRRTGAKGEPNGA